jgi:hypothetical protein
MPIAIQTASLKKLLLEELPLRMEASVEAMDELLMEGIPHEVLDGLRQLPVTDFKKLSEMPQMKLFFEADWSYVLHALRLLKAQGKDDDLLDYFIRFDATTECIARLFKMSKDAVIQRRHLMNQEPLKGRPVKPKEADFSLINTFWYRSKQSHPGTPERERLYECHRSCAQHLSIGTMVNCIAEMAELHDTPVPAIALNMRKR